MDAFYFCDPRKNTKCKGRLKEQCLTDCYLTTHSEFATNPELNIRELIMKTYNIFQIANMFHVSEETVRRWIRDGKLKATKHSKKSGYDVSIEELNNFTKNNPKYTIPNKSSMIMGYILGELKCPPIDVVTIKSSKSGITKSFFLNLNDGTATTLDIQTFVENFKENLNRLYGSKSL